MADNAMSFDQLNMLSDAEVENQLTEYFDAMEITPEQKKKRVELAKGVYGATIDYFGYIADHWVEDVALAELIAIALSRYDASFREAVESAIPVDSKMDSMLTEQIDDINGATQRHIDSPYFTSDDRALIIAENTSNKVYNSYEFNRAIEDGFTLKTWLTMRDAKVRDTHWALEGETIPINDTFVVGGSLMQYPMDESYGASADEIIGCRCSLSFKRK